MNFWFYSFMFLPILWRLLFFLNHWSCCPLPSVSVFLSLFLGLIVCLSLSVLYFGIGKLRNISPADLNSCFIIPVLYRRHGRDDSAVMGIGWEAAAYLEWCFWATCLETFAITNILFYLIYIYLRQSFCQADENHWGGYKAHSPFGFTKRNKGEWKGRPRLMGYINPWYWNLQLGLCNAVGT